VFATHVRLSGGESFADYECFGTTSRFRTLLQTFNPWAFAGLRRVLAEFRPDVVHVRMFLTQLSPLILPLLRDLRSLYHVIWYRPVCPLRTKVLPDGTACHDPAGIACSRHRCLPLRDWVPHPLAGREPLDTAPVSADPRAHRATRVAPDVIERTSHGGSGTRSGIDPGGGVAEAGGQEWHASEHAGPAGQESREGPPVIYSARAERQVGERATRFAMWEE
jgi:hypothetical protein